MNTKTTNQGTWLWIALLILILPEAASGRTTAQESLKDAAGRIIAISAPFKRIISLYGAHTENLFRLGLDEQIIGVTRHETYPEEALKKNTFSQQDDPEKFLAARPDLVLIRPMIDRAYPQLIRRLEASGITVVSLQPGNVAEMYQYWMDLGILTGKTTEARRMVNRFKTAIAAMMALTKKKHHKKRVYFEAIHSKMKTFSPGAMALFALEIAGGVNIAADAVPVKGSNIAAYGKERILSHAGQIDVYLAQVGTMNSVTKEIIVSEPGFQVIRAVKQNEIHLVDEKIVSRPTFRILKGIARIGTLLYPDIFGREGKQIVTRAETDHE